ncbi:MAG: Utp14-domain-containing protein [Amphiamblys sp. WSBS2006]|nr:MAG: Utp14-domain-containing protein [Amphiamblys sp. WSBS2006]
MTKVTFSDLAGNSDAKGEGLQRKIGLLEEGKEPERKEPQRAIGEMRTSMSKWSLKGEMFPLYRDADRHKKSRLTPMSKFERSLFAAIDAAGTGSGEAIVRAEEEKMKSLPDEEKRSLVQRLRKEKTIQFSIEKENRRKNKIKSKEYRKRLKRKQPQKTSAEIREEEERERIEDRVTQKKKKRNKFEQAVAQMYGREDKAVWKEKHRLENCGYVVEEIKAETVPEDGEQTVRLDAACETEAAPKTDGEQEAGRVAGRKEYGTKKEEAKEEKQEMIAEALNDEYFEGGSLEEFQKEKMKQETGETREINTSGWNSWGGPGLEEKIKETRKEEKKQPAHLIINEQEENPRYAPKKVPFMYRSYKEYQKDLETPLGREWNSEGSFLKRTKARVTIKAGVLIEPPSEPAEETLSHRERK